MTDQKIDETPKMFGDEGTLKRLVSSKRISEKLRVPSIAKHFSSYVNFWIRHGSKWSPAKFQSDDVIVGSTGVKLVKNWSSYFG